MENQVEYLKNRLAFEIDSYDLYTALNLGEKITVLDTRKLIAYEAEHIPFAINIPHREINLESTRMLDKECLYVTYCDGVGCNASTKGALHMARLGFKVKELIGGIEWWKKDGYTTEVGASNSFLKRSICDC